MKHSKVMIFCMPIFTCQSLEYHNFWVFHYMPIMVWNTQKLWYSSVSDVYSNAADVYSNVSKVVIFKRFRRLFKRFRRLFKCFRRLFKCFRRLFKRFRRFFKRFRGFNIQTFWFVSCVKHGTAIPIIIEGRFQVFQRFSSSKLVLENMWILVKIHSFLKLCMYACVCVFVCVRACKYVPVYVHVRICSVCVCACMCMYVHVCVFVCVYIYA